MMEVKRGLWWSGGEVCAYSSVLIDFRLDIAPLLTHLNGFVQDLSLSFTETRHYAYIFLEQVG